MINSIKAELYRLINSKAFWIVSFAHVLFIQAAIFMSASGGVGVRDSSSIEEHTVRTTAEQLPFVSSSFSMMEIFVIVFLAILVGNDLSQKLYKNTLTSGQTRIQFFITKNVVMLVLSLLQFIIFYGVIFVENTLFNGLGDITNELLVTFIKTVSVQFLCVFVWISLVSLVIYLTQSNIAGLVTFFGGTTIMSIPSLIFPNKEWLKYLEFSVNMQSTTEMLWKTAVLSIIVILLSSFGALIAFKKKDL